MDVWKLLVSISNSSSTSVLIFSPVIDFNSFNISFWDSNRKPFISEVISSFKEVLKLSKGLPSILGDFALQGPAKTTS